MVTVSDRLAVEREAITSGTPDMARYLQHALGQKLVAYLTGKKDQKMVGAWARGQTPRGMALIRLRYAYQAARVLAEAYDDETARAWFIGSNHLLDGDAPAYVLRHAEALDDVRHVVPAARAFAGSVG